jgi:hypothetical protein
LASTPALRAALDALRDVVFAALRACCWRPRACPPFFAAALRFAEVPERDDAEELRLDDELRLRELAERLPPERLLPERLLDERLLAPDLLLDDLLPEDRLPDERLPDARLPEERLDPLDLFAAVDLFAPLDFLDPPLLLRSAIFAPLLSVNW